VAENRLLQALELLGGLNAELLDQRLAGVRVGLEGLCLPARAVEREHQLPTKPLAPWVLGHECLELSDYLGVVSELELSLDKLFARGRLELLEACDFDVCERFEREIRQRRAPPERKRLVEQHGTALGSTALGGLGDQALEAMQVDALRVDVEHVAGLLGTDRLAPQNLAQIGDEVLERADRRFGWLARPELFDEPVRGDDLAGIEQQQSQEGPPLSPRELERAPLHEDLERPQDAELDFLQPGGSSTAKRRCLAFTHEPRMRAA
jgi:hypothetical protein